MSSPLSGVDVWSTYFTEEALDRSSRLILEPASFRLRTTETAELDQGMLKRRVKLELSSGPGPHLVPIASPKRGALIELLEIQSSDDVSSMVLVSHHTALFAKLMLERRARLLGLDLRSNAVEVATSVGGLPSDATRNLRNLLDQLSEIQPGSAAEDAVNGTSEFLTLARDAVFMKLFRWFRSTPPLLIPCNPKQAAFSIQFATNTGVSEFEAQTSVRAVRSALGLTVYDLELPTRSALFTQSYHFQFKVPTSHYVRSCDVVGSRVAIRENRHRRIHKFAKKSYAPASPASATFAEADVDGYAHFHIAQAHGDPDRPRSIAIAMRISERPLGQLFAALVRWLIVLSIVLLVDNLGPRIVRGQESLGASLLLALPGIVGISSLLLSPVESPRMRPVGPQFLSFLAGITSILATALFLKWRLDYTDCVHSLYTDDQKVIDQQCLPSAPSDVTIQFQLIEILGVIVSAVLLALFSINVVRYFFAERARATRRSYVAKEHRRL